MRILPVTACCILQKTPGSAATISRLFGKRLAGAIELLPVRRLVEALVIVLP